MDDLQLCVERLNDDVMEQDHLFSSFNRRALPDPLSISEEIWGTAEQMTSQEVLSCIHPTLDSEEKLKDVTEYVQRLIRCSIEVENFGSRTDTVFCGVFDVNGPYGHMVTKRVRDSLPLILRAHWEVNLKSDDVLREISLNTPGSINSESTSSLTADEELRASVDVEETGKHLDLFQTLKDSFLKAYKFMDRELKMHTNIDCFYSGTIAVTVVKQGQDLLISNVGDSRAVMENVTGNGESGCGKKKSNSSSKQELHFSPRLRLLA